MLDTSEGIYLPWSITFPERSDDLDPISQISVPSSCQAREFVLEKKDHRARDFDSDFLSLSSRAPLSRRPNEAATASNSCSILSGYGDETNP